MLSRFCELDRARWPVVWVLAFFMVQAIPATLIRASNLEEGRILAMARGALEDGHWLQPHIYGERFIERPVLASWMAALFGDLTGGISLWSLRIPHLAFFLGGAVLIYGLLRRNAVSKSGSVFGAFCWLCMPMVAAKFINAEADIVLSTLLFAALFLWWQATIDRRVGWPTWLGVGLLLALAGLTKGPQPVAYFTLGIGAYLLLKAREQIAGFLGANALAALIIGAWYGLVLQAGDIDIWRAHSRLSEQLSLTERIRDHLDFIKSLIAEFLPGSILIGPAVAVVLGKWKDSRHDLLLVCVMYTLACTLVLALWPGGVAARYAMPATMTLAVICGLMFDRWRYDHPRVIVSTLVVACLIFTGLLVRGWVVMPFWPHLFKESQIAGTAISDALRTRPGPLYVMAPTAEYNMLVYVKGPIHAVTVEDIAQVQNRVVAVMQPDEVSRLAERNPNLAISEVARIVSLKRQYRILDIQPKASD